MAKFVSKPDAVEAARHALTTFIEPSRAQKGCKSYDLQQSLTDPASFYIIATWDSEEDLQAHSDSEEVAGTLQILTPHLDKAPEVVACRKLS